MIERRALPPEMTPPGWPTPARMAAIMEALRRDFERYRREFEERAERATNEPTQAYDG